MGVIKKILVIFKIPCILNDEKIIIFEKSHLKWAEN